MNQLVELYDATKKLEETLNREITVNNRQEVILEVNHLVETRGKYMEELKPPYTDEENKLGEELIVINRHIQKKLDHLFEELKVEMKQVKQQKKSTHSYISPYDKLGTTDGVYMDTKE